LGETGDRAGGGKKERVDGEASIEGEGEREGLLAAGGSRV